MPCARCAPNSPMPITARATAGAAASRPRCIHPAQVAAVNAAFAPDEAELAWALRVLQAYQASA